MAYSVFYVESGWRGGHESKRESLRDVKGEDKKG
jgi:hypothetical protein